MPRVEGRIGYSGRWLIASGLLLAGMTTTALQAQCVNDCGVGDVNEGEPCLVDDDTDTTNPGCSAQARVFTEIGHGTICGRSSTYLVQGVSHVRDTDWYRLSQARLAAADLDGDGRVTIQSTLASEFDGATFVLDINNCNAVIILGEIGFSAQGCETGASAAACIDVDDHPGGIAVWVSTAQPDGTPIFEGFECDTGRNDYTLLVECLDAPFGVCPSPVCGDPDAGACNEANGTPGCDDEACCAAVCDIEPVCCEDAWDEICVEIAQAACNLPPTCGDVELTHSLSFEILAGNSVACSPDDGQTTTDNAFARSYDLAQFIPDQTLEINCVTWGIERNSEQVEVIAAVNVYLDTDGGDPNGPDVDLELLASTELVIPGMADGLILIASFDPPVMVEANSVIVVDLDVPDLEGITGIWAGSNQEGQTGPSYIRSFACGVETFTDFARLGFPNMHLVNAVIGDVVGDDDCPWDLDGDGEVEPNDLITLLRLWSTDPGGPPDFDGDGNVGPEDLMELLMNWGDCP